MSIYRVPASLAADIWPAIKLYVERACEYHPFMDADSVLELVQAGRVTLFISTQHGSVLGFCAVEVVEYPRRTVANVLGVGGKNGFLEVISRELIPIVADFADHYGATVVTLSGRPGWLRALRHLGGRSRQYITMWADTNGLVGRRINKDNDHSVGTSPAVPT